MVDERMLRLDKEDLVKLQELLDRENISDKLYGQLFDVTKGSRERGAFSFRNKKWDQIELAPPENPIICPKCGRMMWAGTGDVLMKAHSRQESVISSKENE